MGQGFTEFWLRNFDISKIQSKLGETIKYGKKLVQAGSVYQIRKLFRMLLDGGLKTAKSQKTQFQNKRDDSHQG